MKGTLCVQASRAEELFYSLAVAPSGGCRQASGVDLFLKVMERLVLHIRYNAPQPAGYLAGRWLLVAVA